MERQGDEIHIRDDEVRAGSTPHIVRYILGISLILAVAALSAIWITGALNTTPETHASQPMTAQDAAVPSE